MATKIKKSFGATIQGILDIRNDGSIFIEVEDIGEPISLAEFIQEFNGKDCKVTVAFMTEG